MKKRILLFLLIFLLTGCSLEYNLTIENDEFKEKINVSIPKSDENEIEYYTGHEELAGENILYNKTIKDSGLNKIFSYSHKYNLKEYQNRNNPCFANSKISEDKGYYSLYASEFVCFESFDAQAEEYKINIKTNYNVVNENADNKKGNVYTWKFTKQNYKKKNIVFQYTKQKKTIEFDYKSILIPFFISLILCIGLIVFQISKNKQKMEV